MGASESIPGPALPANSVDCVDNISYLRRAPTQIAAKFKTRLFFDCKSSRANVNSYRVVMLFSRFSLGFC